MVQPVYAWPCVPPGHELVVSVNEPDDPPEFTVTLSVAVADPAEFVAVSV